MEFKGTKGKWTVNRNNIPDLLEVEYEIEGDNLQVAISFDFNDAQLIASAPELLEACIDICNADNTFKLKEAREKAQKAIIKALGQ